MATLTLTLFGALHLHDGEHSVVQAPSGKIRNLLAYLLLNRHTAHGREHLAGVFWGDEGDQKARHCLNTALWRLNRLLDAAHPTTHPYLRVDTQTIGWNTASDFRLDVDEFESRCILADQMSDDVPDQRARLYKQAVALYRADLLVDCYEDWCLIERERFRHRYLHALGQLMRYHTRNNEYEMAGEYAHRILACDPLREDVHRDLMALYLAMQQPADALRQYHICEELVRRELDEEPMPETQALLTRIIGANRRSHGTTSTNHLTDGEAEPARQLASAMLRLREALAAFDLSRNQLEASIAEIEEISHRLDMPGVIPQESTHQAIRQSHHAAGAIKPVVVDLEHVLRMWRAKTDTHHA